MLVPTLSSQYSLSLFLISASHSSNYHHHQHGNTTTTTTTITTTTNRTKIPTEGEDPQKANSRPTSWVSSSPLWVSDLAFVGLCHRGSPMRWASLFVGCCADPLWRPERWNQWLPPSHSLNPPHIHHRTNPPNPPCRSVPPSHHTDRSHLSHWC